MNRMAVFALLSAATLSSMASTLAAEEQLSANVPFAFTVADRSLPAGEYRIQHDGSFLTIENREKDRAITVIATPGERTKDGRSILAFDEVNGVRFLRRVATPNGASSAELAASRTEMQSRDAERQPSPMNQPQQEVVPARSEDQSSR